ncbi:MAG: TonB-dependent receptor, partial [Planctomycetes bacterium]|nr:TonB-dependent receptor [Planctomycetota bacterium]
MVRFSLVSCIPVLYGISAFNYIAAEDAVDDDNRAQADKNEIAFVAAPLWDVTYKDDHKWVEAVSRRRQNIETAAQATVVLSHHDLNNTPAPDLIQRLRYEAGVDVYQSRHSQFDIGIRGLVGLNSPKIIAQIDGRDFDMFDITGVATWIGVLHPTDIVRTEIIKGPGSVTHGANAFGGVIAIKDRDVADFHELHTQAQIGSDGLFEVDATALGPMHLGSGDNPFYFKISAGATMRDDTDFLKGFDPGTPFTRAVQNSETDIDTVRYATLLGMKLPHEHTLELEYYDVEVKKWDWLEDFTVGTNNVTVEQQTAGIRLQAPWGEIRYLHYDNASTYSNQIYTYEWASDYRYNQGIIDSTSDLIRAHANHKFGNHFITGGMEFERWDSDSNFWHKDAIVSDPSTYANRTTYNRGVFTEDQWEPNDRWTLSAGLRYDNHSIVGDNTSPRLGANYSIDDTQYVRATLSTGYRLPVPLEGYLDQYFYRIADDLDVEKVTSFSIGWQKHWYDGNKRHRIGVDLFYNRAKDPAFFVPLPGSEIEPDFLIWNALSPAQKRLKAPGPFFEYQNIDNPYTVYGTELTGAYYAHDMHTEFWTNITLQSFHYDENIIYQSDGILGGTVFQFYNDLGDDVNGPPKVKISAGSTWEHKGWHSSAAMRYVGSRNVFSFAASSFLNQPDGLPAAGRQDAYTAFDVAIGYN